MSWRVTGSVDGDARYVAWVDGRLDADPVSLAEVGAALEANAGVPETPTGPIYRTRGIGDERGAYLLALYLLDFPQVSGDPPPLVLPHRASTAEPDDDVVY